jgi:hypothetical protein
LFQQAFVELLANPVNKSGQPFKHFLGHQGKSSLVRTCSKKL